MTRSESAVVWLTVVVFLAIMGAWTYNLERPHCANGIVKGDIICEGTYEAYETLRLMRKRVS